MIRRETPQRPPVRFVDTNILIYAVETKPAEAVKQGTAKEILSMEGLTISVQVLQEFYSQMTRSSRLNPLSHSQVFDFFDEIKHIHLIDQTYEIFQMGTSICQRFRISYYDGAILAAAKIANCIEVYTEDLNHGQDYDGVVVINPFLR